ncbi:MAG TPA: toprim domain-containing protein, partial [Myxococcales bacterium]|nr:toprim domain-containing protein [Myxococcales bacterium]
MATSKAAAKTTKARKTTKKASAEKEAPVKESVSRSKGSTLVVVESPTKAKTIKKYLGAGYVVKASVGHVMDLPKSKIGVDVENGFEPVYEVIESKKKVVAELKAAAKGAERILLATDPDREGEAIAWHVYEQLKKSKVPASRILFNEITKKAIQEAIQKPLQLNRDLYDAQQARRVLDRLVGYQISPILWKKVRR